MENLREAKIKLMFQHPFFASIAVTLVYTGHKEISTCICDGKTIRYNPVYFTLLTVEELKSVIAHIVMHLALKHHLRRNGRSIEKWNAACDYAINPILQRSGFTLPNGFLYHKDFECMSAEKIYQLLDDKTFSNSNFPGQQQSLPDLHYSSFTAVGDIEDPTEGNPAELEQQINEAIVRASDIARKQGKLPGDIERIISDILQPKVNWMEALAAFVTQITHNDYNWQTPSRRFLNLGIFLPALVSPAIGQLVVVVDTSASIHNRKLNQFATELKSIVETFNINILVIYCDAQVSGVQEVSPQQPLDLQPKGGNGTSFKPAFSYLEKESITPQALIYLTDGGSNLFPPPPDYPVLWVVMDELPFNPPFGETIAIAW